ncbi:hybrid sensor histidine kinase/response regulator [Pseudorhodobacter aquimaris]|uniref:hybrid sensor histidine kinase/response regulator n=1 Tax=Pseudorhodobacter aquimaris TaxID=687412 RepID=UPI00067D7659|nr:hybrid sensor histidine kinase/response regulator [Pseudorhodobacter aquimaris]
MINQPSPDGDPMTEEMALLGHDIQSALADILAGLSLIEDQGLAPKDRQQLYRTRAASKGLARLFEDGMTTLLTQAPALPRPKPVLLAKLLESVSRRWTYDDDSRVAVEITLHPDLPDSVICDRAAVERILSNLISNAVTHSGGQPVTVEISHPSPTQLLFTVRDHGPGFPESLTHPRPTSSESALPLWQTAAGHGLGLRIVQTLAQRIRARIVLRNPDSGGGLAEFHLPVTVLTNQPTAPAEQPTLLEGKRVLIAEDSTSQALFLEQMVTQCGAHATIAQDGLAAAAILEVENFDLVLLDQELPGKSGLQICADLVKRPQRPRIAILTAYRSAEFNTRAKAAGADLVLSKPITSADHLITEIRMGETTPVQSDAFLHLLDIAGPVAAAELVAQFQADLEEVQAQLAAALPTHDWHSLRAASHTLIALAGTAGATDLEATARSFNHAANASDQDQIAALTADVMQGVADLLAFIHFVKLQHLAPS